MAAISTPATASVRSFSISSISSSSRGSSLNGSPVVAAAPAKSGRCRSFNAARVVCCRAEKAEESSVEGPVTSRRLAMALLVSAAAVSSHAKPADAAYGDAANVFGATKTQTGFTPYVGNGFKVDVPTKWNPSKEVEFPGQVIRFEDNFDVMSNLCVTITKSDKSSITDYGSPVKLLTSFAYLLGKQSYSGKTFSEGGFLKDEVAQANVLGSDVKLLNGKTYYTVSVLTRTADGDEGGKHQLIVATIDNGKLYIMKAQAGDKRWFKGSKKFVEGAANSFNVV